MGVNMNVINEIVIGFETLGSWMLSNPVIVVLSIVVVTQWIGFQALLLHYHFFRQSLQKPRADATRFAVIERTMEFQMSQVDKLYEKVAELKKELNQKHLREEPMVTPESLESRFMTLGEMKLKQRLSEIKTRLS
jgi:hypothetical protein